MACVLMPCVVMVYVVMVYVVMGRGASVLAASGVPYCRKNTLTPTVESHLPKHGWFDNVYFGCFDNVLFRTEVAIVF